MIHFRPPKFHLKAYLTRKVAVLATLVVVTYMIEEITGHHGLVNKAHEITLAAFCEHIFFGIPFDDPTM